MYKRNTPDFGLTAEDYTQHRAGFPKEIVERLAAHGVALPGRDVVDLGTGTGSLARLFAQAGARVTAVDPAVQLLDQAKELDRAAEVDITYRVATAESTGLSTASYDIVSAGQSWHWFDAPEAGSESRRLLRPGGWLVIAHFDWLPLPGNVVEATEQLITAYNSAWSMGGGTGLYPRWLTDVATSGFAAIETFSFDLDVPYTPQAWTGRIRASAGVGASLPQAEVDAFSAELSGLLRERFPRDMLRIPHRTWAVVARKPSVS